MYQFLYDRAVSYVINFKKRFEKLNSYMVKVGVLCVGRDGTVDVYRLSVVWVVAVLLTAG